MTTTTGTLTLTTAIGGHAVYAALKDGTVKVDGVERFRYELAADDLRAVL